MYEFEVSYESSDNNDPIKTEIQNLLNDRTQASTSFDCYKRLIAYIFANAAKEDDKYAFMDEGLSDLDVVLSESINNQKIKFKLKDVAIFDAQLSVAEKKAVALKNYFAFLKSQGGQNLISEYLGLPGKIFKVATPPTQPPTFTLVDDLAALDSGLSKLAEIVTALKAETDPQKKKLSDVGNLTNELNGAINIINSKTPPLIDEIEQMLQASFNVAGNGLLAFFNGNEPPLLKQGLLSILLEEFAKRCTRTPNTINNRFNVVRVPNVLKAMGIPQVPVSTGPTTPPQSKPVPDAVTPGSSEFTFWLNVISVELSTLIGNKAVQVGHIAPLLFSTQEDVIYPAMRRLKEKIKAHLHMDYLELAGNLAFDSADELAWLVQELAATINSLLDKVRVATYFSTDSPRSKIQNLPLFKFYVFDDLNEYAALMNQNRAPFGIDMNAAQTFFNSINTPLLGVEGDALSFFNCDDHLYLTDWSDPPVLNFLDNSGSITGQIPLTAEVQDLKKRAELTQQIVMALTNIWPERNFNLQRRYLPLYLLKKDGSQMATQLMWLKATGRTQGVGRSDEIDSNYYLWSFAGDIAALKKKLKSLDPTNVLDLELKFNETVIGSFLGLEAKRCAPSQYVENKKQIVLEKKNKISYLFLPYAQTLDSEEENFVLCNTPYEWDGAPQNSPLRVFKFYYFRKVGFGGYDLQTKKVLKTSAKPKNRPRSPDLPTEFKDGTNIGLNLPISLNIPSNYQLFSNEKKGWGVVKNKGNWLESNRRLRKDAAKVMGIIKNFSDYLPASGKTLAANALVNSVIARQKAGDDWRSLKITQLTSLPTDQDWCHLQGHGDSGEERVGNFVSGSKHCNTEQLAIEQGHRPITHHPIPDTRYRLNSSGYLLDDDSMKELGQPPIIYLHADKTYEASAFINNLQGIKGKSNDVIATIGSKDLTQTKNKAPIAKFVRYKISKVTETPPAQPTGKPVLNSVQVFDYVFEGQSEFFDKNQYNILTHTVSFMLDEEGYLRSLVDFYIQNYLNPAKASK